jgi:Spy/CpxP family protein refolding chaperone
MKRAIITFLSGALLTIGVAAFAGHHGGGHGGPHDGPHGDRMAAHLERMAEQLELTDGQRAEIRAIAERNTDGSLREAMKANRKALKEASQFDNYDAGIVAELAAEQGQLVTQSIIKREAAKQEMLAVLTEAQRDELKVLQAERRGRMMERRMQHRKERAERRERDET